MAIWRPLRIASVRVPESQSTNLSVHSLTKVNINSLARQATMPSVPISLATLPAHSIFNPSSRNEKGDDWELVDSPTDSLVGSKSSRLVLRDKDMIIASGSEVRICSLAGESFPVIDGAVGAYRVLKSECLNFGAESLVLNPTGRLLAVVGRKQIAVIVLPTLRAGESNTGDLECRAFSIDEFEYSSASQSTIEKVLWHPFGESGESLWILTADGKLQEYDVRRPDDPTQTFTFLPQSASSSSSKFTAIDPLSRHATSFAFTPYTPSTYDFSPLTVTVLIANGDVYTMSPILPLRTELTVRYLQGLKAYTKQRRRRAEVKKDGYEIDRVDSWDLWVSQLIKQYKEGNKVDKSSKSSSGSAPGNDKTDTAKLHPPHLTSTGGPAPGVHRALVRQGPVVFSPGPEETDDDTEESYASGIAITSSSTRDDDDEEHSSGESIKAMCIAWSSGRVDIGHLMTASEPVWVEDNASQVISTTVPILESVFVTESNPAESPFAPSIVQDVVYSDTIHVQHAGGLASINMRPLLHGAIMGDQGASSFASILVATNGSAEQAIIGSGSFCNISLGYGILALTTQLQLASAELDFRALDSSLISPSSGRDTHETPAEATVDERSLLSKSIDITALINSITAATESDPRNAVRSRPDAKKPLDNITTAHLTLLGEITSQIRKRTESIRAASQTVENRLDLQVREYQRQIKLLKSARGDMKVLRTGKSSGSGGERVEAIASKQRELSERLDRVLSSAMASHEGADVSETERKWFDELDKLGSRVGDLSRRFDTMRKEADQVESAPRPSKELTPRPDTETESKDIKPLEAQVKAESEEIRRLYRKMDRLSVRVEAAMIEGEDSD